MIAGSLTPEHFLAAYSAVNDHIRKELREIDFLAAYSAVNGFMRQTAEATNFLAAYSAVNANAQNGANYPVFLAAYSAVNRMPSIRHLTLTFLSCLLGSELASKTYNHLKEKEIPGFFCQKPSFFEVS